MWSSSVLHAMRIFFSPPPPQHHLSRSATEVLPTLLCRRRMYPNPCYSKHVSAVRVSHVSSIADLVHKDQSYLLCILIIKMMLNLLDEVCRAKANDRNFDFGQKWVIDIFGTFKTSFTMCISILSQFRCFSEKIMGSLNRNFEKPRRNQGRTLYNTSYGSVTLFGTLKMSYGVLPFFLLSIKVCRI